MADGKFLIGKPSGGVTTVTMTDGASNTNLVLPESGTVATLSNIQGFKNLIVNGRKQVKIQGYGYLLNGVMNVPTADGNSEYELIKQWLAEGNTPEPEFTEEELLKQKQDEFRANRNTLLDKVDKAINIAEDLGNDSTLLRTYRQALRDATIKWAMPESVL